MLLFSLISLHFKYIKSGLTLRNRIVYAFLNRYILTTILTQWVQNQINVMSVFNFYSIIY